MDNIPGFNIRADRTAGLHPFWCNGIEVMPTNPDHIPPNRIWSYMPYRIPSSFGTWLRQCRQSDGLSQKVLAKVLGVDESTIVNWERDEHRALGPSLRIVRTFFGSLPGRL